MSRNSPNKDPPKEEESSDDEVRISEKRSPATDCRNLAFSKSLMERQGRMVSDFLYDNKLKIAQMSAASVKEPRRRLEAPDDVQVYGYGGQYSNIYEF